MEGLKPKEIEIPTNKLDEFKKIYSEMYNEFTSKSKDDIRRMRVEEMKALYGDNMAIEIGGIAKPITTYLQRSTNDYVPEMQLMKSFIRRNKDIWLINEQLEERNKEHFKTFFELSRDAILYAKELFDENKKLKEKIEEGKNRLSDKEIEEQRKEQEIDRARAIPVSESRKKQLEDWYNRLPITKDGQLAYIRQCNPKLTQLKPNEIEFIQQLNNTKHKWVGKLTHLAPPPLISETKKPIKNTDIPEDFPKPLDD